MHLLLFTNKLKNMKSIFYSLLLASMLCGACTRYSESKDSVSTSNELNEERKKQTKEEMEQKKAAREAQKAEREARIQASWDEFEKLSDDEKNEWIVNCKKSIDRRDSIQAAKRAEMEKKWATFDKATQAEKIELLKMRGVVYHKQNPRKARHDHQHVDTKFPIQEIQK